MLICTDVRTDLGCQAQNVDAARFCMHCGASLAYAIKLADTGTLIGLYAIESFIGYGGFGAVYRARDSRDGALVALKESFGGQAIGSFQDEFALLHQLRHDHLPAYFAMFEEAGNGYLVMEYVPGRSLEDIVTARASALPEKVVFGSAVQICAALSYLHTRPTPLMHRDIKPANIRLTPDGQIKLVDFGLIKQAGTATRSTRRAVTPAYAPIEQYSRLQTDVRSDIYALAATLYHLLTGQVPASAIDRASGSETLIAPSTLRPDISATMNAAVMRGLETSRELRWQSVADFQTALLGNHPAPVAAIPATSRSAGMPLADNQPAQAVAAVAASTNRPLPPAAATPQPDSGRLVISARNAHRLEKLCTVGGSIGQIYKVVFSSDWHLAALEGRRAAALYATEVSESRQDRSIVWTGISRLAVSPDGRVYVRWDASRIEIFQLPDGRPLAQLQYHARKVDFSQDSRLFYVMSDEKITVFHTVDWTKHLVLTVGDSAFDDFAISPDGRSVSALFYSTLNWYFFTTTGHRYVTWSADGRMKRLGNVRGSERVPVQFSRNTQLIITQPNENTLQIYSIVRRRKPVTLRGHIAKINDIAVSPDEQLLATAADDWDIGIVEVTSGKRVMTLKGHQAPVTGVAFNPDGQLLASCSADGSLYFWNVSDGSFVHKFENSGGRSGRLVFHPDGTRLACIGDTLTIWHIPEAAGP
jgi:eukaryotic-like serine/threonine-protein kinase